MFDNCLQQPWSTVTYTLVGDTATLQYFDIDAGTGGLYVKKDLRTTSITRFVAEIRATDGAGRTSTTNAFRTITVEHNIHAPQFPDDSCDRTVSATGVGTVVTLRATDADRGQ